MFEKLPWCLGLLIKSLRSWNYFDYAFSRYLTGWRYNVSYPGPYLTQGKIMSSE